MGLFVEVFETKNRVDQEMVTLGDRYNTRCLSGKLEKIKSIHEELSVVTCVGDLTN